MERFGIKTAVATKRNLKICIPWLLVLVACVRLRRYYILTLELTSAESSGPPRLTCTPSSTGNVTRRIARYQNRQLSLQGLENFPNNHSPAAVCEFKVSKHSDHFPHAAQQLLFCWSYWNLPNNRFKEKVLVRPQNARGFPKTRLSAAKIYKKIRGKDYGFVAGMISAWEDAANVTVTSSTTKGPPIRRQDHANTFLMKTPKDARLLTQMISSHYGISTQAGCRNSTALPRIGILNRSKRSSRSLLNVNVLQWGIQYELGLDQVEVVYFEKASFLQQVEFMANVDILISPHGAQLTGIPFMPECSRILELFPAFYYYDDFFGSLAEVAGVQQYLLYLSDRDPATDWDYASTLSSQQRRKYRNVNLCPPVATILDAIREMVGDWKTCCESNSNQLVVSS